MPPLSQLGTYLSLPAPRGQALARSSTPTAAAGEAAGSLKAAIAAFVRQLWLGECIVRAPIIDPMYQQWLQNQQHAHPYSPYQPTHMHNGQY